MRKQHTIFIMLAGILFAQCNASRKVTYDIPAAYPEEKRKLAIEFFEKGKELYRINCSECHGIYTRGKDGVPNFNKVQFDNYSARFMSGDPMNHAIAKKMSEQQLSEVIAFLRYKKRRASDTAVTTLNPGT